MKPSLTYKLPSLTAPVSVEVSGPATHPEKVLDWRKEEFVRMGFMTYIADFLASTRIDLHQMEDLLKAGCEHRTAMEILLGTMWSGEDAQWSASNEAT